MPALKDVLTHDLLVIFCGTAVGSTSAALKAYYARPGNRFWRTLQAIGLTPNVLDPAECWKVSRHGIGLTDLAKSAVGTDSVLTKQDFGVRQFRRKILKYRPQVVAFTSKRAAKAYFGRDVDYGLQAERIGESQVFVLNSTSGQAAAHWNEGRHWKALGKLLKRTRRVA